MGDIGIFLVDDNEPVRQSLRRMLELEEDFVVVGDASNAEDALWLIDILSPNVVLMDIRMPQMGGLEAIHSLRTRGFAGAVIVLSLYDEYL